MGASSLRMVAVLWFSIGFVAIQTDSEKLHFAAISAGFYGRLFFEDGCCFVDIQMYEGTQKSKKVGSPSSELIFNTQYISYRYNCRKAYVIGVMFTSLASRKRELTLPALNPEACRCWWKSCKVCDRARVTWWMVGLNGDFTRGKFGDFPYLNFCCSRLPPFASQTNPNSSGWMCILYIYIYPLVNQYMYICITVETQFFMGKLTINGHVQ